MGGRRWAGGGDAAHAGADGGGGPAAGDAAYPVVLGAGMPMFGSGFPITEFTLDTTRTFGNGVVVRTYRRKR